MVWLTWFCFRREWHWGRLMREGSPCPRCGSPLTHTPADPRNAETGTSVKASWDCEECWWREVIEGEDRSEFHD